MNFFGSFYEIRVNVEHQSAGNVVVHRQTGATSFLENIVDHFPVLKP